MKERFKRLLVLCVDRDDDVGRITGVRTPIIGYDQVLKVALDFALKNPEDSDSNALFAALQTCAQLKQALGEENVEVAVLAGTPSEGVEADLKILNELDEVLKKFKAEGAILVSDGPTDEQVLPIIQSKLPVVSVRRVIVQQSRGVEETFVVLTRYAKKLVEEEKFRKYSLGVPGLLMIVYAVLSLLNIAVTYTWIATLMVLGALLIIKGFDVDTKVRTMYINHPITFLSSIASSITLLVMLAIVWSKITAIKFSAEGIADLLLLNLSGPFTLVDILLFSILVIVAGDTIEKTLSETEKVHWRNFTALTFIIMSRQIIVESAKLMKNEGDFFYLIYWALLTLMLCSLVSGFFMIREKVSKIPKRRIRPARGA